MIALLRRLWTAVFPPKVKWEPTGIRYTHQGFDPSKGSAAYQKSLTRTPGGTPLRLKDTHSAPRVEPTVPFRRQA